MKAIGTGWAHGVHWVDFEAVPAEGERGRLDLSLSGAAAEWASRLRGTRVHLAVGRSRTHAVAVVLLESEP
jgi:holo-[acyl-carrier protein] synthase